MVKAKKSKGKRRTVWLPTLLDQKSEETRAKLGLGLSAFIRFSILETIKSMQIEESKK
jgi:hypothetical protein